MKRSRRVLQMVCEILVAFVLVVMSVVAREPSPSLSRMLSPMCPLRQCPRRSARVSVPTSRPHNCR